MTHKLAIIIPAYNEASVLEGTIAGVRQAVSKLSVKVDILVVDDGSKDDTKKIATALADITLSHRRNCGLGAALATGIAYAKRVGYDYAITYDADGQHTPADLLKCYRTLAAGYDVVIGSRFIGSHEQMPPLRRYILWVSNLITYLFFGIWTTDSQSGFRGLGPQAIQHLSLRSNRMEVSSEFFSEIKRLNFKRTEIPIHIRYTEYSLSKGQGNTAGFGVLLKLLYLIGR
jgi:glycosyltransferase involved in cell wall biosynthesis